MTGVNLSLLLPSPFVLQAADCPSVPFFQQPPYWKRHTPLASQRFSQSGEWVGTVNKLFHTHEHTRSRTYSRPSLLLPISPRLSGSLLSTHSCHVLSKCSRISSVCPTYWLRTLRTTSARIRFIPTTRNPRRIYLVDFPNHTSYRSLFYSSTQTLGCPLNLSFCAP